MVEYPYDIRDFIELVKNKDYPEILAMTIAEGSRTERASYKVRGSVEVRRRGGPQYARLLGGLAFFLQNGMKPAGIDDFDFLLFRPIAENLVKKGQLKPEVLNLFESSGERANPTQGG